MKDQARITHIGDDVIDLVERLHSVVDELVAPVAAFHGDRLACRRGCSDCCVDGLAVFEVEAAVIERHYESLLQRGSPCETGGCAFLDESGGCRIYPHRPYVCRTQGLPLRWLECDESGAPVEVRDVCPHNAPGTPIEDLAPEACWTIGAVENKLASLQSARNQEQGRRVALRSLFAHTRRHLPIVR